MSVIQIPIIFFIVFSFLIMVSMIFIPKIIGSKISPSFTVKKSRVYKTTPEYLFNLLSNYKNYPSWRKYLSYVETELLNDGKTKITEHYKKNDSVQETKEVKRKNNEKISIVKTVTEYTTLWSLITEKLSDTETKLTIKETMYVYNPYIRFMLKYILRDENAKNDMLNKIDKIIRGNSKNA